MSKHRRKNRYNDIDNNSLNQGSNPILNNPFGINSRQLLGMLGSNFNMNGLGNLLSNMNMEGFNLNTMGGNPNPNINNNKNYKAASDNQVNKQDNPSGSELDLENSIQGIDDRNIEMLIALKSIVEPSRIKFIDRVIESYKNGLFEENNKKDE